MKKCVGKENFQRMNYLYQLSNVQISPEQPKNLSQFYSNQMITVSKKTVLRLEPNVKQTICKGCRGLLLGGITCTVRIKKKMVKYTCLTCQTVKTYKISSLHKLWQDQPEAIVEQFSYNK